jgi:DNA helicase-2/ATP-dependent DNA helicase PcrA
LVEISHAANRRLYGTWQSAIPSRFIGELPEEHVEIITESGLYGGRGSSAYGTDNLWDEPEVLPPGGGFRGGANRYGPGYRRRGGVSSAKAPTVDGDGYLVDRSGVSSFSPGDRVFHQKFGMGTVSAADGDKLDIAFDKAGDKKVIASFVSRP